jgi:hypothetical protein
MTRSQTTLVIISFVFALAWAPAFQAQAHAQDQKPTQPTTPTQGQSTAQVDLELEPLPTEVDDTLPSVSAGIKGGVSFTQLHTNGTTAANRTAPDIGFFINKHIFKGVGLQIEGLYVSRGYLTSLRTVKMDYLQVPLLATLSLPKIGIVRPILATGPEGSLLIRSRFGETEESKQTTFKNDVKTLEFGWVSSLGLELVFPQGGLLIEGRYTQGLTPAFNSSTYLDKNVKHRTIGLYFGYRF